VKNKIMYAAFPALFFSLIAYKGFVLIGL